MHRVLRALLREQKLPRPSLATSQTQPQQYYANLRLLPDVGVSLATRSFASDPEDGSAPGPPSPTSEASPLSGAARSDEAQAAEESDALEADDSQDEEGLVGDLDSLSDEPLKAGVKAPAKGPGGLDWHMGRLSPDGMFKHMWIQFGMYQHNARRPAYFACGVKVVGMRHKVACRMKTRRPICCCMCHNSKIQSWIVAKLRVSEQDGGLLSWVKGAATAAAD